MNNIAVKQALNSLKSAHQVLLGTMDGVTEEVAHFMPPGKANPIAGIFAHLVFGEDMFLNVFLKQDKSLSDTTWKDKTGFSSPHPTDWQNEYPKWLKEVKMDVDQAMKYAQAVFAETEKYVTSLTDEDFEKPVDMSAFGMGESTVGKVLFEYIIGHASSLTGEISVLKGIQGLKGYPF